MTDDSDEQHVRVSLPVDDRPVVAGTQFVVWRVRQPVKKMVRKILGLIESLSDPFAHVRFGLHQPLVSAFRQLNVRHPLFEISFEFLEGLRFSPFEFPFALQDRPFCFLAQVELAFGQGHVLVEVLQCGLARMLR